MRVLSLFSGIGGFELGLERAGMKTVGFCEINPYCNEVLKARWPHIPNETRGILALNALLTRGLKSFRRAFHVRTFRLPEEAPDLPEPVRDSSGRCFEPFAWFDRNSRSWKTWQRCLVEGWETFSGTWPKTGMTRNGIAYALPTRGRITCGIASGSYLPTPEASNTKARALRSAGRSPRDFLAPVPTPSVSGNYNRKGASKTSGDGLETWVKSWPTPRASENENRQSKPTPSQLAGKHGMNLATAVHLYPTPAASDYKGAVSLACAQKRDDESNRGVRLAEHIALETGENVGGALNPRWVEWLMGFPIGWTDPQADCSRDSLTWASEPDITRVLSDVNGRVGQLRGLGNAVVPQIPEIIGRAIMEATAA